MVYFCKLKKLKSLVISRVLLIFYGFKKKNYLLIKIRKISYLIC